MTTACEVIACARRFIGVPFAHQGRSAQGLDCLGLLIVTAQEAGMVFDGSSAAALDVPVYGARPDTQLLQDKLATHLRPIKPAELQEGDIVLLKIEGSPQHLALLSDYPLAGVYGMIHSYAPARKVVEHRYDQHWQHETYAAFRLPWDD